MISQNNSDYMAWSQFLKGNYGKGVKRLESILNSPPQAADLIKDKAALAVIFGGYDKQTDGLLSVVANSKYADQMARNYIGSVADSDAAFASAATPEMVENVCLASSASAACAKQVWKNDPERFVTRAKSDVQLDLAAKALKGIDASDFASVPVSLLSKLSPYVGKNDRSGYLHLVGQEVKLGFDAVSYTNEWRNLDDSSLNALEFVVVDVNADRDETGGLVGFTLMSKYPLHLDSSNGPAYSWSVANYRYGGDEFSNPDSIVTVHLSATCMVSNRLSKRSGRSFLPLFRGQITDIAKPVRKTWFSSTSTTTATTSSVFKEAVAYLPFWQPTLGNLFGDELASKLGDNWCSPGDTYQYEWLKDFSNVRETSVSPKYVFYLQAYSSDKIRVSKEAANFNIGYNPYLGSYYPRNMLTSSWITEGELTTSSKLYRIPVIGDDGSVSPWTYSTTAGSSMTYLPNIYMCI